MTYFVSVLMKYSDFCLSCFRYFSFLVAPYHSLLVFDFLHMVIVVLYIFTCWQPLKY